MVRPVREDARGIVMPETGLAHFRLDRYPPSPPVARFVDRYWVAAWDLRGRPPYTQQVLAHPVVNVVFTDGTALAHGVKTRIDARTLSGAGRALGIMFRPAGFRPFLDRPASAITDRAVPLAGLFGPRPSELPTAVAERAAADPALVRVDALAAGAGIGVRQLQRRFADHVGISAKALIRRYRLYEAAEQARLQHDVDWADLAVRLSYSDQAHLSRDFSALIGMPPRQYALACRALPAAGGVERVAQPAAVLIEQHGRLVRTEPGGGHDAGYLGPPSAGDERAAGLAGRHAADRGHDPHGTLAELGVGGANVHHEAAVGLAEADHGRGGDDVEHDLLHGARVEPGRARDDLRPDPDLDRELGERAERRVLVAGQARGERAELVGAAHRPEDVGRPPAGRDAEDGVAFADAQPVERVGARGRVVLHVLLGGAERVLAAG